MLSHFPLNIIIYTLISPAALPESEAARVIAIAGVIAVVLLTLVWAWRTLTTKNRLNMTDNNCIMSLLFNIF